MMGKHWIKIKGTSKNSFWILSSSVPDDRRWTIDDSPWYVRTNYIADMNLLNLKSSAAIIIFSGAPRAIVHRLSSIV